MLPQFWKQFFEASANVSLSGYEEQPNDDSQQDQTLTTAEGDTSAATDTTHTTLNEAASYETSSSEHLDLDHRDEDIDLSSLTLSHSSTPRPQPHHQKQRSGDDEPTTSSIPPYPSYEPTLHQSELGDPDTTEHGLPTTPGKQHPQDISTTPTSSPLLPPAPSEHDYDQQSTAKKNPYQKASDPVLHRMLDKTYRVQATPLGKGGFGGGRTKFNVTPKDKPASRYPFDDSPISSPEPEAPQLHEEIFSSPLKAQTPGRKPRSTSHSRVTPKPGISVLTPAKKSAGKGKRAVWDSDEDLDDDDDFGGYSPPKTMQFHIPQSRLMKTPGMFPLHSLGAFPLLFFSSSRELCCSIYFTDTSLNQQPRKHPNAS